MADGPKDTDRSGVAYAAARIYKTHGKDRVATKKKEAKKLAISVTAMNEVLKRIRAAAKIAVDARGK